MEEKKELGPEENTDSPLSTAPGQLSFNPPNVDVEANPTEQNGYKITRAVTAQDWTGPDDQDNPQNWPLVKKAYHVGFPALFALFATYGSSSTSPAVADLIKQFGISQTVAFLGVSLYVLGLAFGPVMGAPLSETYGRLNVYRGSMISSMLFTVGAGFSKSIASLLVCRFFAGLCAASVLSIMGGTAADCFPASQRGFPSAIFMLSPFLGTVLSPVINGFAAQYKGWRWTQWTTLIMGASFFLFSILGQETHKQTILKKRAKRLGIDPPKRQLPAGLAGLKFLLTVTLFRPIHMLLVEPIVLFISIYASFAFGVLFAFLPAFSVVFPRVYGFTISQTGLAFIPQCIGYLLAVPTALAFEVFVYQRKHREAVKQGKEHLAPEHRLYVAMVASVGIPIGLFWFGWASRRDVHWIVPMIGTLPFAWGNLTIFTSTVQYLVDTYGALTGASALAANGLLRYLVGAAFPLFAGQMYTKLGIGWASSLLGFISLGLLPIPFILFKYGPVLRAKSHYETIKT